MFTGHRARVAHGDVLLVTLHRISIGKNLYLCDSIRILIFKKIDSVSLS